MASMQGIHCPSDRPWAAEPPRRRARRRGRLRLAQAAEKRRAHPERHRRAGRGRLGDPELLRHGHAAGRADGQPPGGFDPDQKLGRAEALRTITLDAAYGSFAERERGSIEVGKLADLVVLSQDILSVPEDALMKTEVLATIVGGRVLFEKK